MFAYRLLPGYRLLKNSVAHSRLGAQFELLIVHDGVYENPK